MHHLPDEVPVTGTDWFLHAFDQGMRQRGDQGNVCHLVLRLGQPLDPDTLDVAVASAPWLHWLASLRLQTSWWRRPVWKRAADAPPVRVHRHTAPSIDALQQLVPTAPRDIRHDPPLWLQHVRAPDGDALVLTFHHAAMDARGAELALRRLGGSLHEPASHEVVLLTPEDARGGWGRLMSAKLARDSVLRFSLGPLRYPSPPRLAHPAALHYRRLQLDEADTLRAGQQALAHGAALGAAPFHLAVVARALNEVVGHRLRPGGDFLVPMPLDRRRRNADGPLLGNQVSLLFYRLEVDQLADPPAVVRSVVEQMRDHVRARLPEAFETLLGMCRSLPASLLRAIVSLPTLGRMASFGFSDTGLTLGQLDTFLGLPVTDAWHLPGNLHPPGITVICSRHGGRLSFCTAWLQGALSEDEVDRFERRLRALLTERAP
jgi:hypothetical protein